MIFSKYAGRARLLQAKTESSNEMGLLQQAGGLVNGERGEMTVRAVDPSGAPMLSQVGQASSLSPGCVKFAWNELS